MVILSASTSHVSLERKNFEEVYITADPKLESFPELLMSVNLTCEAEGDPEPNITWFKDGVLLPEENRQMLTIREISLTDRGFYHCNASNFDPNDPETTASVQSNETVINIKGIQSVTRLSLIDRLPGIYYMSSLEADYHIVILYYRHCTVQKYCEQDSKEK